MDLWTFHRYQQPRLCIDEVEHQEPSGVVTLRAGAHTYRLAFDDSEAAAEIAAELVTLTNSNAPLWKVLRQSSPDTGWFVLGNFLDRHSLICESKDQSAEHLTTQVEMVQDCVRRTSSALIHDLPAKRRAQATANAAILRDELKRAITDRQFIRTTMDPFNAEEQPNFYLALTAIEFEYLQRSSPLTLSALDKLLAHIVGDDDRIDVEITAEFCEAIGVYDLLDLERHLWSIAYCIAMSTSDEATRFSTPPIPLLSLSSGLEFMRQAEILTRTTLGQWGPNRYVTALQDLNDRNSPLIIGTYIEQYHVTRRFVEIVAPLLSKRLSVPLREMMFRYFGEEVGHETFESKTCEVLGVSRQALDTMLPLPVHYVFVDVLTVVAELDPITAFASTMVFEGIFGELPNLSSRLASLNQANHAFHSVSNDHEHLNETLNHNSIARCAFANIGAVSVDRQVRALRRVLFLLELNHRAWNGLADFYGSQYELCLQGTLRGT